MQRLQAHLDDGQGFQRPVAHRMSDSAIQRDPNAADRSHRPDPNPYARFREYSTERRAKRAWGEKLEDFLRSRGGLTWNPVVAGRELDLYVLYHEVCRQGGVEAVVNNKGWKKVTAALGLPPSCTNAAYTLRRNYYRWLYAFECLDVRGVHLNEDEVSRLAAGIEPQGSSKNAQGDEAKASGPPGAREAAQGAKKADSVAHGRSSTGSFATKNAAAAAAENPPDSDESGHWWSRKRKFDAEDLDAAQRGLDSEAKKRVEMQEDWEHATNLVQAARSKALLSKALSKPTAPPTTDGVSEEEMSAAALSLLLNDLTDQVLELGGPNIITQGWSCSLAPSRPEDKGASKALFIGPHGEHFSSAHEVVMYLQREGQMPQQDITMEELEFGGIGHHQADEPITVVDDDSPDGEQDDHSASGVESAIPSEQQQRAALFGVPRTIEDEEDVMISMLCNTVLPLVLDDGRLIIKRLGEIEHHHPSYHTSKHIFPVGFRAVRTWRGLRGSSMEKYDCEILHCGRHPLFRITPLDDPARRTACRTPGSALKAIFDGLPKADDFRSNITGEQFFGLEGYERVRHLIEALPGANLCTAYTCWARGRPPTSLPTPVFRITRPRNPNPLQECLAIVQDLAKHRCAWPFLEPTKPSLDPEYVSRVPRPMDLSTVLAKVKEGSYQNPHQVRVDVNQIWRNCVQYSGPDDDAVLMAREVSEAFEMLYADRVFYPAQAHCRNVVHSNEELVGEPVFLYDARQFLWVEGKVIEYDRELGLHRLQLEGAGACGEDAAGDLSQEETSDEAETLSSIGFASDRQLKSDPRLPDLVPASAMVKVDRREQARQQRQNSAKRAKGGGGEAGRELRWVRVTASDIALKEVISKDTAAWPGRIE